MTVHLFGAASSPGCCNFALKTTTDDNEECLGPLPAEFLRRNFYVDDGLKSLPTVEDAVELIKKAKEMCSRGGFNLNKFTLNKREVLQQIPVQDRAEEVRNLDLDHENPPIERALGVQWCIESDNFKFKLSLKERPCSRRGSLLPVSSIFDRSTRFCGSGLDRRKVYPAGIMSTKSRLGRSDAKRYVSALVEMEVGAGGSTEHRHTKVLQA